MNCKICNYQGSRVVETRQDEKSNRISRRRECIKCGYRFTTTEHFKDPVRAGRPFKTITPITPILKVTSKT